MRSELRSVWSETWHDIWVPIIEDEGVPRDIFCELFRELAPSLKLTLSVEELADIIDSPQQSMDSFKETNGIDIKGEQETVAFFEAAHDVLNDLGGEQLSNRFFDLVNRFLEKFSLRYDLRRPFVLCPTLPGVFSSLMGNLRLVANQDSHMGTLMDEFEDAIRDLRHGRTDGRIKTCMSKQFMLLEALCSKSPGVSGKTLGTMCDELNGWPHATVKESLKKLYGFASDYPGIRHGGNSTGKIRNVDMRDLVAMSIMLAGFTPYLTTELCTETMYGGSQFEQLLVPSK